MDPVQPRKDREGLDLSLTLSGILRNESDKMVSKDECSHVTFMEMSLSAAGAAQGCLSCLAQCHSNSTSPRSGPQNDKTM